MLITVSEEKASILENFFHGNPFADYSQMDEIQQRTQLDEQIIRVNRVPCCSLLSHVDVFFLSAQHYFDSARNHWQNSSSYYPHQSSEIYAIEANGTFSHSGNSLPLLVDSRLSLSPSSILSFEQISLLQQNRGRSSVVSRLSTVLVLRR